MPPLREGDRIVMTFEVRTTAREQFVDISEAVAGAVAGAGVAEGIALVFVPHTTAGVTVNENADPDVPADLVDGLRRIAPRHAGWRHAEGNSDGHLKSTLAGCSATLPVSGGRAVLGTWQGVFLCEFDGPRTRMVHVQVVGA